MIWFVNKNYSKPLPSLNPEPVLHKKRACSVVKKPWDNLSNDSNMEKVGVERAGEGTKNIN